MHEKMNHSENKSHEYETDHGKQKIHPKAGHSHHIREFKRRFFVSLILTIPILALSSTIQSWFGFSLRIPFQKGIIIILSSAVYFYGGWPFLKGGLSELRRRLPGMMTLIATAITVAYFYSVFSLLIIHGREFFWELATLIDVMLLGHWIEAKSVMGASRALEELVKIMPTMAHLITDGEIKQIPVSQLKIGDVVLVRPGEKIPSDGLVIEGESHVNEALLTGEAAPVHKTKGDRVIGGAINGTGILKVKIDRVGEETYLHQVLNIVKRAQESRSRTQDLANRAAGLLFYVAMASGIITFAFWTYGKSPDFALQRAVSVLVIACPHALGLAIPLVVAISTAITARHGILVRDRSAFEAVRNVNAVVFDKTGTLTEGVFGVSETFFRGPEEENLALALSLEQNSEHIIARSISAYAEEKGISPRPVTKFKAIAGKGVYGEVDGKKVYLGGSNLLKELGIEPGPEFQRFEKGGNTLVYIVVNGELTGVIALSDRIRESSRRAVEKLKKMGLKIFMLTGDSEEVARWVSQQLGIDRYFAGVLPHEKAEKVEALKREGYRVAMVGDGINDAPALVVADVGIAIGAGTDVAIESADLILVRNDPESIPRLIEISRKTYSKMVQNLWWAAGYNIVTIPLAAGVLYRAGILINPAFGAVLMSLSTVIVAINSQTLRKYLPEG